MKPRHTKRVLHGHGSDRTKTVHTAGKESLQIGLQASTPTRIRTSNRQSSRNGHPPHPKRSTLPTTAHGGLRYAALHCACAMAHGTGPAPAPSNLS